MSKANIALTPQILAAGSASGVCMEPKAETKAGLPWHDLPWRAVVQTPPDLLFVGKSLRCSWSSWKGGGCNFQFSAPAGLTLGWHLSPASKRQSTPLRHRLGY